MKPPPPQHWLPGRSPIPGEPYRAKRANTRFASAGLFRLPPASIGVRAGGLLFFSLFLPGCAPRTAPTSAVSAATVSTDTLAPGVVHRAIPTHDGAGIDLVDITLARTRCRLSIQTQGITRADGYVVGVAHTPHEWLTRTHGLLAVNGGYFGAEDKLGRKELVGLLVQQGRVRHAAPPLTGSGSATIRRGQYIRSAFGLLPDGTPQITWAATESGAPQSVTAYEGPMSRQRTAWKVVDAVGCGPTLISGGKIDLTQYQERLVSPGPEARTFVAYDGPSGHPGHLVIGIASGTDFQDLAVFLSRYFPRYDRTRVQAAMCLDGGGSTQMSYLFNGAVESPRETGVTVPDALVLRQPAP